jgi:hypothetical protein
MFDPPGSRSGIPAPPPLFDWLPPPELDVPDELEVDESSEPHAPSQVPSRSESTVWRWRFIAFVPLCEVTDTSFDHTRTGRAKSEAEPRSSIRLIVCEHVTA